jgi:ABC-type Fe3+-hydroxamate transport system substrate-binding protein
MIKQFTDQMGRTISVEWPVKRIISLVPSQTELLYSLGLTDEVIGITKFCVHPKEWFHSKTRVGGTKKLDFEKIAALKPDLIIGNKEENEEVQIKQLMQEYPVWMSDIHNLGQAFEMMNGIGEITNKEDIASTLIIDIKEEFEKLGRTKKDLRSAAYFIWRQPYMSAGSDTFISDMMARCGFKNLFEEKAGRYPEVSEDELKRLNPDVVLLSSEPFPFSAKHIEEFQKICPKAKIVLVDGEYFSWYGSRLLGAPGYFTKVLDVCNNL